MSEKFQLVLDVAQKAQVRAAGLGGRGPRNSSQACLRAPSVWRAPLAWPCLQPVPVGGAPLDRRPGRAPGRAWSLVPRLQRAGCSPSVGLSPVAGPGSDPGARARGASGRGLWASPASLCGPGGLRRDHSSVFTQNLFGKMADILEKIKK